jgi:hypothetical protein
MYGIEMQQVSPEFAQCWQAAALHLQKQVQGGALHWLRSNLTPPFLEHLSFRIGNQLFFIRVVDASGHVQGPGKLEGLFSIADGQQGHACLMPMTRRLLGGTWESDHAGWGLIDARTGLPVDPAVLVTDEKIKMTDWEVHDFAVEVVRNQLVKEGWTLMSWQGNPCVDPSIWFIGESKVPEWVVVRAVRYPLGEAQRPRNWAEIAAGCARMSRIGHFASVAFASAEQPFENDEERPVPLWRGHGVHVNYPGLA